MVVAFVGTYLIEIVQATGRSPLVVMSLMLILHLLPTLWLPFRDFDKKSEGAIATIYTYSGPVGYGIFLAAGIFAWLNSSLPEEYNIPFWLAVAVTMATYFSFWLSSTMSNKSLFDLFNQGGYPTAIVQLVVLLRTLRYHKLAVQLMEAVIKGKVIGLIGSESYQWHDEVRGILMVENCNMKILDNAIKALLLL